MCLSHKQAEHLHEEAGVRQGTLEQPFREDMSDASILIQGGLCWALVFPLNFGSASCSPLRDFFRLQSLELLLLSSAGRRALLGMDSLLEKRLSKGLCLVHRGPAE